MKEIKDVQAYENVINQDKPVLLDFYADWCGPCQALLPTVEKLADKYEDDFVIQKVNVDKFPALAQKYGVRSIPALFVIKDKKVEKSLVGYQSEKALETLINTYVKVA
jgi:thioredoxin